MPPQLPRSQKDGHRKRGREEGIASPPRSRTAAIQERRKEERIAHEIEMIHGKSAQALFASLHPTQQDVLLCLKDYANLVSWSQVTPAACDPHLPDGQSGDAAPWKSLERILSPEALLAASAPPKLYPLPVL